MQLWVKIWQKQGCRWLWVCRVKNKTAIHGPGIYCLSIRYGWVSAFGREYWHWLLSLGQLFHGAVPHAVINNPIVRASCLAGEIDLCLRGTFHSHTRPLYDLIDHWRRVYLNLESIQQGWYQAVLQSSEMTQTLEPKPARASPKLSCWELRPCLDGIHSAAALCTTFNKTGISSNLWSLSGCWKCVLVVDAAGSKRSNRASRHGKESKRSKLHLDDILWKEKERLLLCDEKIIQCGLGT